ncbi:MAG: sulfatase-like hydrolase/transferase [Myxococcota bacterium]
MSRDDLLLALAWAVIPLGELAFAAQGFVRPAAWQIAVELGAFAILAANHVHFAPRGWLRSPLWPAAVAVGVTLIALAPGGPASRLVYAVGLVGILAGAVAGAHRLGTPRAAGLAASLLAVVAQRWAVLAWDDEGRSAVDGPATVLLDELTPLPASGSGSDGPPVVLVTVDTLRWDHLVRTRAWQRLAERGRAFPRAMSTSSWTLPAMASLLTGELPASHGATARTNGGYQGVDPAAPRLPVDLARAGYTTAAVFSNAWLTDALGFRAGFHRFWHVNQARPHRLIIAGVPRTPAWTGAAVTDRALAVAAGLPDRGAFLWVHYVDPHLPWAHAEDALTGGLADNRLRQGLILDDAARADIRAGYAHEVDLLDAHLERLLDGLQARGWLDRGYVFLTADHGEELYDHGSWEHGHSHHGEVVDVGLVVSGPGVAAAAPPGVASLVDVPATIRAVAGLPPVGEGIDLRGPLPADRIATAYGNAYVAPARSARQGSLRVLVDPDGTVHAYDLAADPTEHAELSLPDDAPLVRAARAVRGPDQTRQADINVEALEALGYLE